MTDKKTLVVFGGSGGLGKQIVHDLWYRYNVIALSSNDCDIANFGEVLAFFQNRQIDIVINAAGLNYDRMLHKIDLVDMKQVNELMNVNVNGAVNIAAAALSGMRERGYGRIIMLSSLLSTHVVPGAGVYGASKAFIDRLVKSVAQENAGKGITAHSIQCGYMDGGLTYRLPDPAAIKNGLPLKRFGTTEELVSSIEFLIRNEYTTGSNLDLTGGACF